MTSYQIFELIISGFTALGTCGATILALYFWFNSQAIRLRFHAMHGDAYGAIPNIPGGYLVIKITNTGYNPIHLELAGIKFIRGYLWWKDESIIDFSMQNNNLTGDRLPKTLHHGDSYIYAVSWNSFAAECNKKEFRFLNAYACVSALNHEVKFQFDKYLIKKLGE